MYIDASTVITAGGVLSAVGLMIGLILKVHKWYLKMEDLDKKIEKIEEKHKADTDAILQENRIVCEGLMACLDGLQQLGANHTVPTTKNKLEEYINKQAHK